LARFDPPPGLTVASRVQAVLEVDSEFSVVFVHRDAEANDPQLRVAEIASGLEACNCPLPFVAVVPVRMTEAWLLLDEQAIRDVAGNPRGMMPLDLPRHSRVENVANPKELLKEVLFTAADLSGVRRQRNFTRSFSDQRRQLLGRLDVDGPIGQLPSWQAFTDNLNEAVRQLDP